MTMGTSLMLAHRAKYPVSLGEDEALVENDDVRAPAK